MASVHLTGYGSAQQRNGLQFSGDESTYEMWECKFLAYMKLRKLKDVILPGGGPATADQREEAYAELVPFLDYRSLNLVMRDAADDGRLALQILREHYAGHGQNRVLSLYTKLTALQMQTNESITDYIIRAETVSSALRNAGEVVISDGMLIAITL